MLALPIENKACIGISYREILRQHQLPIPGNPETISPWQGCASSETKPEMIYAETVTESGQVVNTLGLILDRMRQGDALRSIGAGLGLGIGKPHLSMRCAGLRQYRDALRAGTVARLERAKAGLRAGLGLGDAENIAQSRRALRAALWRTRRKWHCTPTEWARVQAETARRYAARGWVLGAGAGKGQPKVNAPTMPNVTP